MTYFNVFITIVAVGTKIENIYEHNYGKHAPGKEFQRDAVCEIKLLGWLFVIHLGKARGL